MAYLSDGTVCRQAALAWAARETMNHLGIAQAEFEANPNVLLERVGYCTEGNKQ